MGLSLGDVISAAPFSGQRYDALAMNSLIASLDGLRGIASRPENGRTGATHQDFMLL